MDEWITWLVMTDKIHLLDVSQGGLEHRGSLDKRREQENKKRKGPQPVTYSLQRTSSTWANQSLATPEYSEPVVTSLETLGSADRRTAFLKTTGRGKARAPLLLTAACL